MIPRKFVTLALGLMVLVAAGRIAATYRMTAPGFDETCHVAAAVELLDRHTYTIDPVHPPLSRVAIGIPLYLAGVRYPNLPPNTPGITDYNVVGNHILYDDGHFLWKLVLARAVMLPFLAVLTVLVFLWTRHEFGDAAGLAAAALFTTLPMVLAFSSLVYTDIPTATTQFAALFVVRYWLEKSPTWGRSLLLGIAVGLAFVTKFTSVLFLFWAGLAMLVCKWLVGKKPLENSSWSVKTWAQQLSVAALTVVFVVWLGYGFSVGHIRESMQISADRMPSFQHFPAPVRSFARDLVMKDPLAPAPALLRGIATVWVLNKSAPESYLFGKLEKGGRWYFFPAGVLFKSHLPFLFLGLIALLPLWQSAREGKWTHLAPAVSALAILASTIPVSYKAAIRHVMIVFPLLAMLAGCGAMYLWRLQGKTKLWGRTLLAALLAWQGISTVRAQRDFIAYFNELAGNNPADILVAGCDLDCGQDVFRLSDELRARHVTHATLAMWTSADMSSMNLPPFDTLQPFHPVTGWIAISERAMRMGDSFHMAYLPEGFAWLSRYTPVKRVGETILLYYIPEESRYPTATGD